MNGEIPQDRTGTGELDPARRAAFAQELLRALAAYCPGSRSELRGSLALGTADAYSDIDIAWTVPDDRFDACLDAVPEVLGAVVPLDSLRTDPDSRNSRERRLLFAAFRGLPLFWRVDLEVAWSADPEVAWRVDPEVASASDSRPVRPRQGRSGGARRRLVEAGECAGQRGCRDEGRTARAAAECPGAAGARLPAHRRAGRRVRAVVRRHPQARRNGGRARTGPAPPRRPGAEPRREPPGAAHVVDVPHAAYAGGSTNWSWRDGTSRPSG